LNYRNISRKEFKGQKESLENQEFDNKFFQMLNLFNNVIQNLEYKTPHGMGQLLSKREVLKYIKKIILIDVLVMI